MKPPKPPKKTKHIELWVDNMGSLFIIFPNGTAWIGDERGVWTFDPVGYFMPWGEWVRTEHRPKFFTFLGEFK